MGLGRDILEMSTVTEAGVMDVKSTACEVLLQHRVEAKFRSRKVDSILNRLHVTDPAARDNKERPAHIPEAAIRRRQERMLEKEESDHDDENCDDNDNKEKKKKYKTERDIQLELGDDYSVDLMKKLEQLEKEEEARERSGFYDSEESEEDESYAEIKELAGKIRYKKGQLKMNRVIDGTKKSRMPRDTEAKKRERSVSKLKREFEDLGVDMSDSKGSNFTRTERSSSRRPLKRAKVEGEDGKVRSVSRRPPRDQSGVKDAAQAKKVKKMAVQVRNKTFSQHGRMGESDRHIAVKKPKHLFAGKRGLGKTSRR